MNPVKTIPARGYLAGVSELRYPAAGDAPAPRGVDLNLLTEGGICVRGRWRDDGGYLAWAPLPKGNRDKERLAREALARRRAGGAR